MKILEFRPKLLVEAVRFEHPDDGSLLAEWCGGTNENSPEFVDFLASDGTEQRAEIGDWVIKGVAGFFACKPAQFEAQYESLTPGSEADRATVDALKSAGFTLDSAVEAVAARDIARLIHKGPFGVQIQRPEVTE